MLPKTVTMIDSRETPRRIEQILPGARTFSPVANNQRWAARTANGSGADCGVLDFQPRGRCWSHTSQPVEVGLNGMQRVSVAGRLLRSDTSGDFKRYLDDFPFKTVSNWWDGFGGAPDQVYVVQTNATPD